MELRIEKRPRPPAGRGERGGADRLGDPKIKTSIEVIIRIPRTSTTT